MLSSDTFSIKTKSVRLMSWSFMIPSDQDSTQQEDILGHSTGSRPLQATLRSISFLPWPGTVEVSTRCEQPRKRHATKRCSLHLGVLTRGWQCLLLWNTRSWPRDDAESAVQLADQDWVLIKSRLIRAGSLLLRLPVAGVKGQRDTRRGQIEQRTAYAQYYCHGGYPG